MTVADWIETAISTAKCSAVTVIVTETTECNLRWAHNAVTTNGQAHDRSATVIAYDIAESDAATAVVSGPVADEADVLALLVDAEAAVTRAPRERPSALPEGSVDEDFADAHPEERGGIGVLSDVATGLGLGFAGAAPHVRLFGYAEHRLTTTWLATSTGTRRRHVQPAGRFELNAKDTDTLGSAWVGAATRDFTDVDVSALLREVRKRLGWAEHRVELPAGRYDTILPPGAVADLMIYAYWSMNGRDADEGQNVYSGGRPGSNRIGERLAVLPVTIASDPREPGMEQAEFAIVPASSQGMVSVWDNGAPVDRVEWLRGGVLERLIRTRAGHAATGETTPWSFPTDNLIVDTGSEESIDDLIARTGRGLLLTCLWYIREVDPETLLLTGLTRDGVYLIENGRVVGAVNNFRFNESPVELLRRATEASAAEQTLCREWNDWFLWTIAPALRVPDFNMSTVSPAT